MTQRVLHLDFVLLNDRAGPEDREALFAAAAELATLPQVEAVGVIEAEKGSDSDFDLVFHFLLPDFTALEPFGTDPRYVAFLQGAVAPRLKAFAGADVRLDDDLEAEGDFAACLAIMAPEETYDWEIHDALQASSRDVDGAVAIGLAVGEKQLYRGAALAFGSAVPSLTRPDETKFRSTLISGPARTL